MTTTTTNQWKVLPGNRFAGQENSPLTGESIICYVFVTNPSNRNGHEWGTCQRAQWRNLVMKGAHVVAHWKNLVMVGARAGAHSRNLVMDGAHAGAHWRNLVIKGTDSSGAH